MRKSAESLGMLLMALPCCSVFKLQRVDIFCSWEGQPRLCVKHTVMYSLVRDAAWDVSIAVHTHCDRKEQHACRFFSETRLLRKRAHVHDILWPH